MMLTKEQKKEAINQFKERKIFLGVFAVRCTASGQSWVGASRNLDANRNNIWFSLRLGSHRDLPLQDEWNAHGEPSFEYMVLEKLSDEAPPLLIPDLLKEAKQRWMTRLDARGLL
jgi:hypothetical protein